MLEPNDGAFAPGLSPSPKIWVTPAEGSRSTKTSRPLIRAPMISESWSASTALTMPDRLCSSGRAKRFVGTRLSLSSPLIRSRSRSTPIWPLYPRNRRIGPDERSPRATPPAPSPILLSRPDWLLSALADAVASSSSFAVRSPRRCLRTRTAPRSCSPGPTPPRRTRRTRRSSSRSRAVRSWPRSTARRRALRSSSSGAGYRGDHRCPQDPHGHAAGERMTVLVSRRSVPERVDPWTQERTQADDQNRPLSAFRRTPEPGHLHRRRDRPGRRCHQRPDRDGAADRGRQQRPRCGTKHPSRIRLSRCAQQRLGPGDDRASRHHRCAGLR